MLEVQNIDIFTIPKSSKEAICITTNGMIRKDGNAVMGRGIAKSANDIFHISGLLATYLKQYGNRAFNMGQYTYKDNTYYVFTFPTKHNWRDDSDLNLIKTSAEQIVSICNKWNIERCYLPPVGCANGHLDYNTQVRPVLQEILDDRFVVITEYH